MSEQHFPAAFAAVLTDAAHPLIVGGQAVNVRAEIYSPSESELGPLAPFTSKNADIHGARALADSPPKKIRRFAAPQLPHLATRFG
jgi:hypothetical protein